MKAKKHLGQHFLKNEHYAKKIVQCALKEDPDQCLLEIGPGKGVLSKYLLETDHHLKFLELDEDMIQHLLDHFPKIQRKDILHSDVLKYPFEDVFSGRPFDIVGNFPYNISSQIVFKILEYRTLIPNVTGMFQKEVAQRIASLHGTKTYGILSVLTQIFYDTKIIFHIAPGNFAPPPKVDSSVIVLERKPNPMITEQVDLFFTIVKKAFQQRRKMLRNSLKSILAENTNPSLEPFLTLRPEQLSVSDFVSLHEAIRNQSSEQ